MADTRFERDDEWDADRVPSLIEDDDSLPWLDSDDDDRDSAGFATSRLVILGILALLLIGGVVAAVMLLRNMASDEPPADGSLIAAPEEPYKTRPEDDGGKTFAGTGDTSFAVGEGQTREGQLADRPEFGFRLRFWQRRRHCSFNRDHAGRAGGESTRHTANGQRGSGSGRRFSQA